MNILSVEGIVIRLVPKITTAIYEKRHYKGKDNQELFYHEEYERDMCREVNENSLGGQYLVTIEDDQCEAVVFKRWGIGNTPEEAYAEYLKIGNMGYDEYKAYKKERKNV